MTRPSKRKRRRVRRSQLKAAARHVEAAEKAVEPELARIEEQHPRAAELVRRAMKNGGHDAKAQAELERIAEWVPSVGDLAIEAFNAFADAIEKGTNR